MLFALSQRKPIHVHMTVIMENRIYGEKSISIIAFWCHHSIIMAEFVRPETDYLLFLLYMIAF